MRSALMLLCSLSLLAAAPAREHIEIPDLPTADMRMSWQDFKELLHLIRPAEPDEPEKKLPPVPWSLQEITYHIDATAMEAVRVEAVMHLFVWNDEWRSIPVLSAESALESVSRNGEPTFLTQQDGDLVLFLDEPGAHRLEFVFFVRPTVREGVVSLGVPSQPAASTKVSLRLAEPEAIVSAPRAASVRTHAVDDGLEAELSFPSSESLEINWRLPARTVPAEPREEARVSCTATTIATVSDNFLGVSSRLHFDVLRGETQRFTLRLPAAVQVLAVEGKGVSWDAVDTEDGQRLDIAVNHAIDARYALEVRYEAPIPEGAATIELPRLAVDGMVRHRGFVAIATDGNVEIDAAAETANPKRVDLSDLPAELLARSRNPILHAFQYNDPDFLLPLGIRRLRDVPVRVAAIERAHVTSVLTPDGMLVQRLHYTVRNHHKKFLRVEIGEDAEVWTALVAGELVRPARDNDDDAAVLLPLRKSFPQAPGGGAFAVELTYTRPAEADTGWRGRVALATPRADLMANEVKWEVFLPDDRLVYRSAGDIARLDADPMPPVLQLARGAFSRTEEKRVPRLREGIERFLITDINNPAASALGQSRTYEDALDTDSERPRPTAQVAGVIPIDMPMPRVGRPHYFERTLVEEGHELTLVLDTYHERLRGAVRFLSLFTAFLLGLGAVRLLARRFPHTRAHALALVALALAAYLAPYYAGMAAVAYIRWACLGAVLALVPVLARAAVRLEPAVES